MAPMIAATSARLAVPAWTRARPRLPARTVVLAALVACTMLAGCQSRTDVSATGSAPAQYTHVFLTISQIWFNASSTAGSTDASWMKFTLPTPQSIDLVNLNNGTLGQIASELKLSAGTYAQVLIILADSTDALTSGAQALGATANDEVDYVDTGNVAHTAPLAVLNAAQGIRIATSVTVAAASSTGFGSTSTNAAATTTTTTATRTTTVTGSSSSAPGSTFSTPVVATTSVIIDFDATRDLVPVSLSGQPAFVLNPHPHSYDVKYAGSIQGTVSLADILALSSTGLPDVQVSAETLSSDGTRHVIVKTTLVGASGSFALYPLATASGAPGTYDLVIHGPNIETVIIKSVPVVAGAPGTASSQIGTLALIAADSFLVNFNTRSPAAPTSSLVGFYQTLPLTSEVPYLVETRAVDPMSGLFASNQALSGGSVQYGTFVTGGTTALTDATPSEGAATYAIGAINPAYGSAVLGTSVKSPGNATTVALLTMTAPPLPTGSSANAIQGTVSLASTGAYDNAELFLTYGGALVAAASLNSYLTSGQSTLTLNALAPGGSAGAPYAAGLYNAEIWAWNSANPTATLTRLPYGTTIDMSAGNASGVALDIQ